MPIILGLNDVSVVYLSVLCAWCLLPQYSHHKFRMAIQGHRITSEKHVYCNIQKEGLIEAANQTGTLEDISLRKKQVGDTM